MLTDAGATDWEMAARGLESLNKVVARSGGCPVEVIQIVNGFRTVEELDVQHVSSNFIAIFLRSEN